MSKKRLQRAKTELRGRNSRPPSQSRQADKARKTGAKAGGDVASGSKIGLVVTMLRRSTGASIADLSKATGWQAHSVRGAMSATLKKKLGLKVTSERVDGVRVYRVAA